MAKRPEGNDTLQRIADCSRHYFSLVEIHGFVVYSIS